MKFRSTLLLLLLAGGIAAYLWFYESKQESTRDAQANAGKFVQMEVEKINAISIKNAEGEIELRKQDNGAWMLEKPIKDRADAMTVSGLIDAADFVKADAVVGEDKPLEKEQLKEFGLTSGETKVAFSGGKKPVELLFGKDAAVEGKLYVKLADEKKAYVIGSQLKTLITKKADEFRDRKLADITTAQVTKVSIKTGAGEIELERKNEHWSVTKPLNARGDDAKVGDLISQATTARIESFAPDSANLATYGLQEPRGTVSFYSEGSEKPVVLQIGANLEADKEKTYAKLSSRETVVVLPKSIESLLETKPNDLRDKNLVRVNDDIVDRIHLEAPGQEKLVLARKGEAWVRKAAKDSPINGAMAMRLLAELGAQQVAGFAADVATDLPKYGLDQPSLKVTLSSFASENTAETTAGDKPIVTVLFGRVEGDNVYAKLEEEPFIVTVPRTLLEAMPADPLQWQDLTVYKFKPEEVSQLEVTRPGQPAISLEREKDKWKLAKGDGSLNQVAVQSLVNTLSALRAVRWVGATKAEHGLDAPTAAVTFKTASGSTGKLLIGAKAPDETYFASANGFAGTFSLNRPDEEAFAGSLMEKPAAAAAEPAQPQAAPAPAAGANP